MLSHGPRAGRRAFRAAAWLVVFLVAPVLAPAGAAAQTGAGQATASVPSPRPPEPSPAANGTSYRVGPGDTVSISVSGVGQFDVTARVSNSGKVHVPYAGVIRVAGMTPQELESMIGETLRSKDLVRDPWVTVTVDEYRAQPVYILGEVSDPGQYVIKDEMYLIDLITLSGGFNEVATPVGYLYRRRTDSTGMPEGEAPPDETIEIDFRALNEGTRPELNLKLRGGDVLYVPQRRRDFFFVVGDVLKPGAFEIRMDSPEVLASQAIGRAGGPLRTAKLSKGILVRFDEAGQRQELPVDFKALLEGRQADVQIRPNDVLFIPGSTAKTLAYGLLGMVPGMVERSVIVR